MTNYIGLLRAVNLGKHNRVNMTALRELFTQLGMLDPRTIVQSGNVVFKTRSRSAAALETVLERATAERLGVSTDYIVRTAGEWAEVIAGNPFPDEAKSGPNRMMVMAMKAAPDRKAVMALEEALTGPELLRVRERQVYLVYPEGMGVSRLSGAVIEKHLQVRGTARNWNTVLKLGALAGA